MKKIFYPITIINIMTGRVTTFSTRLQKTGVILVILLILSLLAFPVFGSPGANTHSLDLETDSSQYGYAADSADLSVSNDFTLEATVKYESEPVPTESDMWFFINKSNTAENERSYAYAYWNNAGTKQFRLGISSDGTSGNQQWPTYAYTMSADTWYHVAVTYDAATGDAEFFVDGSSIGTNNAGFAYGPHDSTSTLAIGATPTAQAGYFHDGLIDDVRIWNDIRTSTELSDNYQTQLNGNETDLVGYWMLNNNPDDKGESTDPAGSDSDDLTLMNSPVYDTDVPFGAAAAVTPDDELQGSWW